MPDTTQILLTATIVILTVLFIVLGIQSFLVLWEFRKTLKNTNKIIEDLKSGANVAKIVGTILALFFGKNIGKNFMGLVSSDSRKPQLDKKDGEVIEVVEPKKIVRRFFRRSKS